MSEYICDICGFVYDEEKGLASLWIEAGTKWEDVPFDFVCPLCKASKDNFRKEGDVTIEKPVARPIEIDDSLKDFTALEMSVLCSNLARGCEKQYLFQEQEQFEKLAQFFKSVDLKSAVHNFDEISTLLSRDLEELIPYANQVAKENFDRGAMRALVWNEKATLVLNSILKRYNSLGEKMLENSDVYVCSICGFIHIGDTLPNVCPVCKVPNYKFEKIEGRE